MPDDPIALRSRWLVKAFTRYLRWYVPRSFHAVRVSRACMPDFRPGGRLIVYSNHPSWWDPLLFYLLGGTLAPRLVGYGPMEAAQLARYRIFRRLGVFGIEPGPRGAAYFLRVAAQVLAEPDASLWITAEGAFSDPRSRPIRLRPGLAHLARRTPDAVIVPLALDYPFWDERKPEALARFGPPVRLDPASTVAAWTARLEVGLADTMDALAADAATRDPARFLTLARGRTGVGGAYDAWRRGRALLAGRRFDPAHRRESE